MLNRDLYFLRDTHSSSVASALNNHRDNMYSPSIHAGEFSTSSPNRQLYFGNMFGHLNGYGKNSIVNVKHYDLLPKDSLKVYLFFCYFPEEYTIKITPGYLDKLKNDPNAYFMVFNFYEWILEEKLLIKSLDSQGIPKEKVIVASSSTGRLTNSFKEVNIANWWQSWYRTQIMHGGSSLIEEHQHSIDDKKFKSLCFMKHARWDRFILAYYLNKFNMLYDKENLISLHFNKQNWFHSELEKMDDSLGAPYAGIPRDFKDTV